MKVLIRADAASHIGIGHVTRCVSLALALEAEGCDVTFITKVFDTSTDTMLRKHGFKVVTISPEPGSTKAGQKTIYKDWLLETQQADWQRMRRVIGDGRFDWMVIDSYSIDQAWEVRAREVADRILVIDDLADRDHVCDILLDQNIGTEVQGVYAQKVNPGAILLLGTMYCLLRPEFGKASQTPVDDRCNRFDCAESRVLLFFGGADQMNLTEKALSSLMPIQSESNFKLVVLVGASNKNRENLVRLCDEQEIELHFDVENMAAFLNRIDRAIVACGFICYELAAMKIPSVLVPVSDIQSKVANALAKSGVARVLSQQSLDEPNEMQNALNALSQIQPSAFGQFPTDGANRVVQKMMELK